MIVLESRSLKVIVDESRGGEIVFLGPPDGPNALFHDSWPTPLPAERSTTYGSDTLDWLSSYRGGWQVMFPSAGSASTVEGVPHPLHGDVSRSTLEVLEARPRTATLRASTRLPVQLVRRFTLDDERPVLRVEETARNTADRPLAHAWGHHPAFAASPRMVIDLPPGTVHVDVGLAEPEADLAPGTSGLWSEIRDAAGGAVDLSRVPAGPVERVCYLPDRPAGWGALRDLETGRGVAVAWDVVAFPHLWLWEQIGGWRFPFFGRARIVALEPVSCWPGDGLAAAVERGQASLLQPFATASAWITVALFEATLAQVVGVDRDGWVDVA